MIILIYGEDEYRSFLKQKERMGDFFKKHPTNINWQIFDFSETPQDKSTGQAGQALKVNKRPAGQAESFDDLKNFIGSSSIFSENKLAVILHLSQLENFQGFKDLISRYDLEYSPCIFLLIREGGFEEKNRLPELNFLKKIAKEVNKFDKLSGIKLTAWIKQEAVKNGGIIEDGAAGRLADLFGSDTWRLGKEIEKLIIYKAGEKIKSADVLLVCGDSSREENIFALMNEIFAGRKKEAILIFEKMSGIEDAGFIFNQVVGQFRNLVKIKFGAKDAKLHPFYARKMAEVGHFYDWEKIGKIYEELAKIDISVKTGKIGYKEGMEDFIISLLAM